MNDERPLTRVVAQMNAEAAFLGVTRAAAVDYKTASTPNQSGLSAHSRGDVDYGAWIVIDQHRHEHRYLQGKPYRRDRYSRAGVNRLPYDDGVTRLHAGLPC
jgi:hypothetical protein